MRIWVTRTAPEASRTAERVGALGHLAITAPVLEARSLDDVALDLAGVGALAFTSAHAIAAVARLDPRRDLPVFTTGDATAAAALAVGFAAPRSAAGDAAALAELIAAANPGRVLCPGPRRPAADLVALLAARGVAAQAIAVYETVPTALAAPPPEAEALLIHSARAAQIAAALIEAAARQDLKAYAISPAAAAPLARLELARLKSAPFPNETALLDLLPR